MKNQQTFDEIFENAYKYASKVVYSLRADGIDTDDLLQNFCLTVLKNKIKYADIISSKRGVYLTLEGLRNNELRKLSVRNREGNSYLVDESLLETSSTSNNNIDLSEKSKDYIESILYKIFSPNGRSNAVHSYQSQIDIVKNFQNSNLSTRAYCKLKGISTATLYRLIKHGPKEQPVPKTITAFLDYHFNNSSIKEIADQLNISTNAVNQLLYESRKRIRKYFELEESYYCNELEVVNYSLDEYYSYNG